MMTASEIREAVDSDSARREAVARQSDYVRGRNPAILKPRPKEQPDNRIPVPFAYRIVTMVMGYMFKPGSVTYSGDGYDDALKAVFKANDEPLVTARVARSALTHGEAFELHWTDGGVDQFDLVPADQGVAVMDGSLRPRIASFLRYWTDAKTRATRAFAYDAASVQEFVRPEGSREFSMAGGPVPHGYGKVPVSRYTVNDAGTNLFDHVTPLVDFYDKIISEDYANELERFASAYLLMAGRFDDTPDENGETEVDKIKRTRIFQDLKENVTSSMAFLTKNVNESFIGAALSNTERLIYEQANAFNPNDDSFGTASGVAQKYKLLGFEYQSTEIESYFSQGMQDRIALCKRIGRALSGAPGVYGDRSEYTGVTIHFSRNLPDDLFTLSQTAANLKGVLSDETILRLFPSTVVQDVDEEMARLDAVADMMAPAVSTTVPSATDDDEGQWDEEGSA